MKTGNISGLIRLVMVVVFIISQNVYGKSFYDDQMKLAPISAAQGSAGEEVIETKGKGTLESVYYGPADFADIVGGFYGDPLAKQKTTNVEAAETIAKEARAWDDERGGAVALADVIESAEAAELIAAIFGEKVAKEDIPVIKAFYKRHYEHVKIDDEGVKVVLIGTGIGGQANVSGLLARLLKPFQNFAIRIYSALGEPFKKDTEVLLREMYKAHSDLEGDGPEKVNARLNLLKKRQEKIKLFLRAASKSGTTPETMFGFQNQMKKSIRLYSKFVYGRKEGYKFARKMINKLYGKGKVLVGGAPIDNLDDDEKMILAIVLDRLILATGTYVGKGQVSEGGGLARTGGSRFDFFAKKAKEKLGDEFEVLRIEEISKVTLYNRFGGRSQLLGPDAWINIFGAYGQADKGIIKKVNAAVRVVAERNSHQEDKLLWGKQTAAFARAKDIKSVYIGLPTALEQNLADALQQLIGESNDVGGRIGIPKGIKPIVKTTTKLEGASEAREDNGSRLYILIEDELTDEETRLSQQKIIERETKKSNHVIKIKIKDHSPQEVAKLYYEMMEFVEWYGNFLLADVLANLDQYSEFKKIMTEKYGEYELQEDEIDNISFDNSETAELLGALYSKEVEKNDEQGNPIVTRKPERMSTGLYKALTHLVKDLNPWYQPGVEVGKRQGQIVAEGLFSTKTRKEIDPIATEEEGEEVTIDVPVRSRDARREFRKQEEKALIKNNGSFIEGNKVYRNDKDHYLVRLIDSGRTSEIEVENDSDLNEQVAKNVKELDALKVQQKALTGGVAGFTSKILNYCGISTQRRRDFDALEKEIMKKTKVLMELAAKADCNEETAKQLALAAFDAHKDGLSVNLSLYAGRHRLEPFGSFVNSLAFVDLLQHATDKQHTDADGDIAGTKGAFQILTHVRETHGERMHYDGMVPAYADGLTDQEMIWCYHQGYKNVYKKKRQIDFTDLRLEGTTAEDVAKMYILFAKANQIYLELNKATDRGKAVKISL